MNLFEKYMIGGPFMHVITLMGVIMLIVAGIKMYELFVKKEYTFKLLNLILLAGSFSVAWGIFSQIIGIVGALEAVREATDISPKIVYGGAIVSFYSTIWGFIVFFVSLLIYGALSEFVKYKQNK